MTEFTVTAKLSQVTHSLFTLSQALRPSFSSLLFFSVTQTVVLVRAEKRSIIKWTRFDL